MDGEVFEVAKVEHHWLPTCPCVACVEERKRREPNPPQSHIKSMSPKVAHTLGYISKLSPSGSVAREFAKSEAQ